MYIYNCSMSNIRCLTRKGRVFKEIVDGVSQYYPSIAT